MKKAKKFLSLLLVALTLVTASCSNGQEAAQDTREKGQ